MELILIMLLNNFFI